MVRQNNKHVGCLGLNKVLENSFIALELQISDIRLHMQNRREPSQADLSQSSYHLTRWDSKETPSN